MVMFRFSKLLIYHGCMIVSLPDINTKFDLDTGNTLMILQNIILFVYMEGILGAGDH